MKFVRSPKAHGWYYAESDGVGYVIAQSEFTWNVSVDGAVIARVRTFKDAKVAAKAHVAGQV